MPFTLKMPKLSPTMEEGTIESWTVKEGDHVEAGDVLFEVATDKATVEHEAIDEGYLRKILVPKGKEAKVNQPVAIFSESKEEDISGYETQKEEDKQEKKEENLKEQKEEIPAKATFTQPTFAPEPPLEKDPFSLPERGRDGRVIASPLAKKIAAENGVNLSTVIGTGPSGRIMKRDVEHAAPGASFARLTQMTPQFIAGSYEEAPLSQMRKAISTRLQQAKTFIPHYYVTQVINAESLVDLRSQLAALGQKLTYNDFVIKACAFALREYPKANSGFDSENQAVIHFKTIDISVAVTIEEGLITPIIRHADYKSLSEISSEVKKLASRAKKRKLEKNEYRGGSFTVSNLGMFGITGFTAILNPPQAAILAIGGIQDSPIVKEGKVVAGKTMQLNLSLDHRVLDGVAGAEFVKIIQKYLENPTALLL